MDELVELKNSKSNPTLSNLGLGLFIVKKQVESGNSHLRNLIEKASTQTKAMLVTFATRALL